MTDLYDLLDIAPDADTTAIKQAYRRLAKKLHPDRNVGDIKREQQFKEITQAYKLLSDAKSRRDYDRGRIDAAGQPKAQTAEQTSSFRWEGSTSRLKSGVGPALDRMIAKIGRVVGQADLKPPFKRKEKNKRQEQRASRAGREFSLNVDFVTAILGGDQPAILPNGNTLTVKIPPGTRDKVILRLKQPPRSDDLAEEQGDLMFRIHVLDHPYFTRRGQDLYMDLPLSLREALQGARVKTPTIEGSVWLRVPKAVNSGQLLRLRGKGVPDPMGGRGDQYVRLLVMLPKEPDAIMAAYLKHMADYADYDVRDHFDRL